MPIRIQAVTLLALSLAGCAPSALPAERTVAARGGGAARGASGARPGQTAPGLEGLALASGEPAPGWQSLRGHVTVLEFWSPWCAICTFVHERMNAWDSTWRDDAVTFLGIAPNRADEIRSHAARLGIGYTVAADPDERLFAAYAISALPTLVLVDAKGIVVGRVTGFFPDRIAAMEREIHNLVSATTNQQSSADQPVYGQ